jgi:hypothetical protein
MSAKPPVTESAAGSGATPLERAASRWWAWRALTGPAGEDVVVRVWLAVLAALAGVWAFSSLWLPYGWDHGCFGYLSDTILRGGLPYRDALDFKGPLTFYIFAALQAVFGRQMWAIRAFDLALLACAGAAGIRIGSQFVSRRAATCTMLMLTLAFASFGNWYTAQPDGWAALGLVVVMYLLIAPGTASTRDAALASAIIGACVLFKPLYVIYMPLVVCALWPEPRGGSAAIGAAARAGLAAAAGFLAPIVVAVAWFAAHGALGDMMDIYVRYNLERATNTGTLPLPKALQVAVGIPTSLPILAIALPPAALGAGVVTRERPRAGILMILWVLISLAAIAMQRKFLKHNYSWLPFFLALGFVAGIGLARLWNARGADLPGGRWLVVVTAAFVLKLLSQEPLIQVALWARYVGGRISLEQYRARFDFNPFYGPASDFGFSVPRDFKIADYLREHTAASDEILVWSDPLVNYLSDRRAITPITVADAFTTWGSEERRRRYRTEFLSEMTGPKASYFGIAARDLAPGEDEQNVPAHFPELLQLLDTEYERAGNIEDVQLFKRRGR